MRAGTSCRVAGVVPIAERTAADRGWEDVVEIGATRGVMLGAPCGRAGGRIGDGCDDGHPVRVTSLDDQLGQFVPLPIGELVHLGRQARVHDGRNARSSEAVYERGQRLRIAIPRSMEWRFDDRAHADDGSMIGRVAMSHLICL
jgi:hypothetical protein